MNRWTESSVLEDLMGGMREGYFSERENSTLFEDTKQCTSALEVFWRG